MNYLRKIYKSCFLGLGMSKVTIADIMIRDLVKIKPETNLIECARKMVRKRVSSLVMVEKNKLVGFLSQKDILWALIKKSKKDLSQIKAIDISPKKIITLKPDLTIEQAMKKIKNSRFYRYPVIENDEILGIISIREILDFKPELYPEFEELEKIKRDEEKLKKIEEEKMQRLGREGICEECGNQDILVKHNGMMMCESCR